MWSCVRRLTGNAQHVDHADGITVEFLNDHYSKISTESHYLAPSLKHTVDVSGYERRVYKTVCMVPPPFFCLTPSQLTNPSLSSSTVSCQWKHCQVLISSIPKGSAPTQHADFRPISVTPVLTRIMERTVVQDFIYPTFHNPPESLTFHGQFAFRPIGSTMAAIITLLEVRVMIAVEIGYFITSHTCSL